MNLTIMSYNIHKGYNWRNSRFILKDIKQAIQILDADVCLIQEVVGSGLHGSLETKAVSENQFEFLADTVWAHHSYGKNAVFPNRHHGNVTLSKYPILEYFNQDISTNRFERRGLLYTRLDRPGRKPLHFFNTHLNLFERSRLKQAQMICEAIQQQIPTDESFILAGDFNDWTGRASQLIQQKLNCERVPFRSGGRCATFPSFQPFLFLDRIFYRGGELIESAILDNHPWRGLSDHLPLMAKIKLP